MDYEELESKWMMLEAEVKAKDKRIASLQVQLAEHEKKLYSYFWNWQAATCFCQVCGAMRTETEANDGECSCGATGLHVFKPKPDHIVEVNKKV